MSPALKSALDTLLDEYASKPDGIPGVSLIVTRSSGNVYEGAAGLRDLGKPEQPMTTDTVLWIASMSKAITSVAALIVVERGLIGLDDDLRKVIPELKDLQVIDRTQPVDGGNYTLKPAQKAVTLRHMLTHSNGLIYSFMDPYAQAYAEKHGIPPLGAAVRAVLKVPSWHEAGTEFRYGMVRCVLSAVLLDEPVKGIEYAGLVIEHVTGQRLETFMTENILVPLGMVSTGFNMKPSMLPRKAAPYDRTEEGKIVPHEGEYWKFEVEQDFGGVGLWSSADDYAKFLRMVLSEGKAPDGKQVIKSETLKMGMQGHLEPAAKASMQEVFKGLFDHTWPGHKRDYSLIGMVFEEDLATGRSKGSVQWDGMPSCHWFVDPVKDIALVQCVQILPFGDPEVQKLLRAVEYEVYKAL